MVSIGIGIYIVSFIVYVVYSFAITLGREEHSKRRHFLAWVWPFMIILAATSYKSSREFFISMAFATMAITIWVSVVSWRQKLKML